MPLLSTLLLVTALACATGGVALRRHRGSPGVGPALVLTGGVVVWTVAYALEVAATTTEAKVLWVRMVYVGVCLVPLSAFLFTLDQAGHGAWATHRRIVALAVVPAVVLVLVWTTDLVVSPSPGGSDGPGTSLALERHATFWALWLYAVSGLVAGTALLLRSPPSRRRGAPLFWLAIGVPWLCNLLHVTDLAPAGIDLTPFGFAVTAACFGLAAGRIGMLDVVPVARHALVEHLRDGVVVIDAEGRIADVNPAAGAVLACPVREAVGRPAQEVLLPGLLRPRDGAVVRDGDRAFDVDELDLPIGRGQAGRLLLVRDVSERVRQHDALRADALTDELTGAANRRAFLAALEDELSTAADRAGRRVGILLLDLDGFKAVNDQRGHAAGDGVLVEVARRIAASVRVGDLVARMGGDEFTVLLPDVSGPEEAEEAAERIRLALTAPFALDGGAARLSASIGLHVAEGTASSQDVLRDADRSMYEAKQAHAAGALSAA